MHARVNTPAALIVLFASLSWILPASADEHVEVHPLDRKWIPSFGPAAGLAIQKWSGSVDSFCAFGGQEIKDDDGFVVVPECESFPNPAEIGRMRPPDDGSDLALTPYVGGVFQLLSPVIPLAPGGPRAFVTAEAQALFSATRDVAKEGDPGEVRFPLGFAPEARPTANSLALTGRGSRTTSEVATLGLGATLGLAFPVDVLGRRLWIKPAVGWYRYKVDVEGVAAGGYKAACPQDAAGNCLSTSPAFDRFRGSEENPTGIQLSGSGSQIFNGIGPGLELDLETGRFGPIGTSLFLGLYAYRVLGDRKVRFGDGLFYSPFNVVDPTCNTAGAMASEFRVVCASPDLVGGGFLGREDEYTASWEWEAKPWIYRTGIGFRFHWVGFER